MSLQKAINVYANAHANNGTQSRRKKTGMVSSKSMSSESIAQIGSIDGGGSVTSFRSSSKTTLLHPTSNHPKFKLLEKFFDLQRFEHEAAKKIQQSWRRSRVLIPWRNAVHAMMAIVTIQRRARGMIARKLVVRWYHYKTMLVTVIQARIRRYLSNHHIRPLLRQQYHHTRNIQRIVRGVLGRHRAMLKLQNLAITRIQALWRGVTARVICDRLWLQTKVVLPIQNAVRRMLALRKCFHLKRRLNYAALVIQRKYRCYRAALAVGHDLFTREMHYRMQTISALTIEEEYIQERIRRQLERVVKNQVKEEAKQAQKKLLTSEENIYKQENDLIELQHQLDILSPRAIEHGFRAELLKNVDEYRQRLTQSKLTHLFTLQLQANRRDTVLTQQIEELEELASQRNRLSRYCTQEYDERRHLNYEQEITTLRRNKRQSIADERRAWQVLYYSKDGKPDKKRRPGRPWHPSVFAGAEHMTYHVASINLLANCNNSSSSSHPSSSSSSSVLNQVQQTVEKVSLQSYLDEVKVYEQLLQPIEAVLKPALMRPRGYGHDQNKELAQAISALKLDPQQPFDSGSNREQQQEEEEEEEEEEQAAAAFRSLSRRSRGRELLKKSTGKSGSWLRRRLGLDSSAASTVPSSAGTAMAYEPPMDELEPGSVLAATDSGVDSGPKVHFDLNDDDHHTQQQVTEPGILETKKKKKSRLWKQSLQRYLPDENSYADTFADLLLKPIQPPVMIEAPSIIKKDTERMILPQPKKQVAAVEVQAGDVGFMTADDLRRQADHELSQKLHTRQRERKKTLRRIGIIPWELLDEVDGERFHFQNEKSHAEFNMKY